ncbi:MAG: class I SAM-dependent methyltransferase [Paracoccaceae bacterium]|nr:class I SAM-dependent methyltransferase [Paracoccaceae bacterium]
MDRDVYERMAMVEQSHWWFSARREIIEVVIKRLIRPQKNASVLEAGCGSGGNLHLLAQFGQVDAFEFDEQARDIATERLGRPVCFGALPDEIPFSEKRYDVIGLFDVLEHIELDIEALRALGARLLPDGALFVTVPAFPILWSRHDVSHHHFRRYTKRSLADAAKKSGLRVEYGFYFNTFLFPLALAVRGVKGLRRQYTPDDAVPGHSLNKILRIIFASERHLMGRLPMPIGLSLGAVLRPEARK